MVEEAADLEEELQRRKELKVKVPTELYIKLHQNKIINGDLLSDVVTEALEDYLGEEMGDISLDGSSNGDGTAEES